MEQEAEKSHQLGHKTFATMIPYLYPKDIWKNLPHQIQAGRNHSEYAADGDRASMLLSPHDLLRCSHQGNLKQYD